MKYILQICAIGLVNLLLHVHCDSETSAPGEKQDGEMQMRDDCMRSPCDYPKFCLTEKNGTHRCIANCYYPRYKASYKNKRRICQDVDECEYVRCGKNRECINLLGGYKCKQVNCSKGFELKNDRCHDIDECATKDVCGKGRCRNYWGSFYCYCNHGYKPCQKTKKCIDVNECESNFRRCAYECMNTEGSYKCQCPKGYKSQGPYCYDVNECSSGEHTCTGLEDCVNTKGSFKCVTYKCPKYMNRVGSNVCKKQYCHKDDKQCQAVKTSSVKWTRYAFQQKQPARTFTFRYSLSGYGYQYRYKFYFAKGNEESLFRIRQTLRGRMQIINIKDLIGPKDIQLVFHADVVDNKNELVDRFIYMIYFNMAEHAMAF